MTQSIKHFHRFVFKLSRYFFCQIVTLSLQIDLFFVLLITLFGGGFIIVISSTEFSLFTDFQI